MMFRRLLWSVLALVLIGFCVFESVKHGWLFCGVILVFAVLPDVALIGASAAGRPGALRPTRVVAYNLVHRVWIPVAFLLVGAFTSALLFVAGTAWLAHVAVDRALGFGLRTVDGSTRPAAGGRGVARRQG